MTTPTNWPNPERPGVPMFPERDGIHMFGAPGGGKEIVGVFWSAHYQAWQRGEYDCGMDEFLEDVLRTGKYIGPVLTPTQIAEMLAGRHSIAVMQAALRVWNIFQEGRDRAEAADMILLEQNGLMDQDIFTGEWDSDSLEAGDTIWTFNDAGTALVGEIRNLGAAS